MLQVKIISDINNIALESRINMFIRNIVGDKKIIDIKISPGPAESECMIAMVIYEE